MAKKNRNEIELKTYHNMRYAKQILKEELQAIKRAIERSDWSNYKEALKVRENKMKDIQEAINLITDNQ